LITRTVVVKVRPLVVVTQLRHGVKKKGRTRKPNLPSDKQIVRRRYAGKK
jgi:hypothetical protein